MKSYAICEVKSLDGDDPNGSFEAILSAATLDRDGEIIDAKAFEPLPDRIPIDIDHGMTVATTVGSGVPFYDGDVLKIKATFSSIPRAQEIRTLVTEKHIDRMSVTFMGAQRTEKDGVPHVTKAELLNAAFVPIPSNREAAVLVAKAFAPDPPGPRLWNNGKLADGDLIAFAYPTGVSEATFKRLTALWEGLNSPDGREMEQRIHDLAVAAGAACTHKTPEPATASAVTDPEAQAAAPAAAKSPADVTALLAAARAQAEAASVL